MAGYLVAAAVLIGGGAVFTRKILTFNRGPAVAVAAIMLTGWAVDRLLSRRRDHDDASGTPDVVSDDTSDDASDDAHDGPARVLENDPEADPAHDGARDREVPDDPEERETVTEQGAPAGPDGQGGQDK